MNSTRKLKAIDDLTNSQGWRIVKELMDEEILQAAMAIAETPNMPLDEINFRRGSIWAAKSMLEIPTKLKMKLQAEAALGKDDSPDKDVA